jgi:hypothetical protein
MCLLVFLDPGSSSVPWLRFLDAGSSSVPVAAAMARKLHFAENSPIVEPHFAITKQHKVRNN